MALVGVPGKAEVTMQQASCWTLASITVMSALSSEAAHTTQTY